MTMRKIKIIVSGGGTAGHIYPAVALVEELKKNSSIECDPLFVGAAGKMEMEKVSKLGYPIIGLPITGFNRKISISNLKLIINCIKSYFKARKIIKTHKPNIVVGFGGYASFPLLLAAQHMGIINVIWEGNSFAGVANRLLGRRSNCVVVTFSGMEHFFPTTQIAELGTPIRGSFANLKDKSEESARYFNFDKERPTLLITGGSLGAGSLNNAVKQHIQSIIEQGDINLIWQCGKAHYSQIKESLGECLEAGNVWCSPFIDNMRFAYEAADLIIARSGSSTVTELSLVGKATIFVPSPNVTDDHQTKNAEKLSKMGGAVLIKECDNLNETLIPYALDLIKDSERILAMKSDISKFAKPNAAEEFSNLIIMMTKQ